MKTNIIAEIGTNFNSIEQAFDCIKAAKEVGADYAKFQVYNNEDLYGVPGSRNTLIKSTDFSLLKACCDENDIGFMCSAFSESTYAYLDPYVDIHKIASCENEHKGILEMVAGFGKPTLVSMGGMTKDKISKTKKIFNNNCVSFDQLIPMYCEIAYPQGAFSVWKVSCLRRLGFKRVGVSSHLLNTDYFSCDSNCNQIDNIMTHLPDYFEFHFDPLNAAVGDEISVSLDKDQASKVVKRIRMWEGMEYEIEDFEMLDCKRESTGFRGA